MLKVTGEIILFNMVETVRKGKTCFSVPVSREYKYLHDLSVVQEPVCKDLMRVRCFVKTGTKATLKTCSKDSRETKPNKNLDKIFEEFCPPFH